MAYKIVYLSKARKEFDDAFDYYRKAAGLSKRFEHEVKEKIKLISEYPKRYPKQKGLHRITKVHVFPFLIIYKFYQSKRLVVITSIYHASRNPKNKYKS